MASTTATCGLTSPCLVDRKAAPRQSAPPTVGLPAQLPPPPPPHVASPSRPPRGRETWKTAAYCHRLARHVIAKAMGEPSAEFTTVAEITTLTETETTTVTETETTTATEMPEIVTKIQDAWEKLEDKYTVSALAVAIAIALWSTSGMISAIDRLPLVPGALELVGIGYTGWFAYRNLVFKPDREALIAKVKSIYGDIIGSS